jgi:hypothetical protein
MQAAPELLGAPTIGGGSAWPWGGGGEVIQYRQKKTRAQKKKTRNFFKTVLGLQFFTKTDEILYNEPLLCLL